MGTILLFDAGNTNTKIGLADESGLGESYTLPTRPANTDDDWGLKIQAIMDREGVDPGSIEACVISSVVPPLDPLITRMARRFLGCDAIFAGRDLKIDLDNEYARPEQVGADILVGCLSARLTYDAENIVVIDFGTATTLACVMGTAFKGGLICPGVLSSRAALSTGTAKLPKVGLEIKSDTLSWGKSTEECLNQGLVFGFASMPCPQAVPPDERPLCGRHGRPGPDHCPGERINQRAASRPGHGGAVDGLLQQMNMLPCQRVSTKRMSAADSRYMQLSIAENSSRIKNCQWNKLVFNHILRSPS